MADVTYREALRRALDEELGRDESVFLMGEEIGRFEGSYKVTAGLYAKYGPRRVRETPIAEEGFVGAGVGAAMLGLRPVVEIMTINFILVAMDMVVNHAAKVRQMFGGKVGVPLVIRTPAGAGAQLTAQHSQSLEVMFAHTPGLKVVAPSTPLDAYGLLKSAIRDEDPVLFLEHKFLYRRVKEDLPDGDYAVPLGVAATRRQGSDLAIVTYGAMVHTALDAARRLEADGVSTEVLDLRTLLPLDDDAILAAAAKTGKVIVLHEDTRTGGIGAEIASRIGERAFEYLDGPVVRVTAPDTPVPYAAPLEDLFIPDVAKVVAAARELIAY